jgi:ABC-2 type transport system permease protein
MIPSIFRLDLRRSRSILVWGSVVAFAYAAVMALVYPTMKANAAAMDEYLKIFPKALIAAFGMTGSLSDPGIFFNTYIATFLWPLMAGIVGVVVATRPVAADLDRGFLELVITSPLPRRAYLVVSIVGQLVVTTCVAAATIAGVLLVGALVGAGFDGARFLAAVPLLAAFAWAVAAFATLLSVVTLSRGMAGGITAGVLLTMYLVQVVAAIEPKVEWLRNLSLFGYFDTRDLIDAGTLAWADVGVLVAIAAGCWVAAVVLFGRRDLAA